MKRALVASILAGAMILGTATSAEAKTKKPRKPATRPIPAVIIAPKVVEPVIRFDWWTAWPVDTDFNTVTGGTVTVAEAKSDPVLAGLTVAWCFDGNLFATDIFHAGYSMTHGGSAKCGPTIASVKP